jgi:hypothetical protein
VAKEECLVSHRKVQEPATFVALSSGEVEHEFGVVYYWLVVFEKP